jgi:hypothetical protein
MSEQLRLEWSHYVDLLVPIGERAIASIGNPSDPQLRQEAYRQLFSGMAIAYLGLFVGDPRHPEFWPIVNSAFNFGSPNPDGVYYLAPIEGSGIYRISGFRGTAKIVDFQVGGGMFYPRGQGGLPPTYANYDADQLLIQPDGSFEAILSRERPVGFGGDWWALDARSTCIMARQFMYDPLVEVDGRFAIERIDTPAIRPRLTARQIEENLKIIAEWAENWLVLTVNWINRYRETGLVNQVTVRGLQGVGGFAVEKQVYVEGQFDIAPDEVLIYETEVPERCRYWSVSLNDMLWSVIDPINRQSSLNGHSARLDSDGKFRAVICAMDPQVPNWLDTAGYSKGTIFGRWQECSAPPTPRVTKAKFADLAQVLPADTPRVSVDQRETSLRARRKGAQLRRRW